MKNTYKECAWHLCDKEAVYQNKFCSVKCKNKVYVNKRRKQLKQKAIDYLGGSCEVCGYNKCNAAIAFHHKDPGQKSFKISKGHTRSWERVREEMEKCNLI